MDYLDENLAACQIAAILRVAQLRARGNTAEEAGVGSVIVGVCRALPEGVREEFLIDCGVLNEMYWLLGPDYPCPLTVEEATA
jgi:hypothetical protein